jgi:hypothetical protein
LTTNREETSGSKNKERKKNKQKRTKDVFEFNTKKGRA